MEYKQLKSDIGLHFFRTIITSTSHELKNVLAIINENAGLLDDMNLMYQKGIPVDQERVGHLAAVTKEQVNRADKIIQRMNRFAHSVDEPVKKIDLRDALILLTDITLRLMASQRVKVNLISGTDSVAITTNPFYLKYLVWSCIDYVAKASGTHQTIDLEITKLKDGAGIYMSFAGLKPAPTERLFPTEKEKELIAVLDSELTLNESAGRLSITFPENIC